ncbi:ammonia-forming cytochrome c nitrite reductase subunit c552 [Noviherbaspirillum sedimenti]|uniref:nitrite reductase (cytochrome; ammonia-forming) n=1 Tax=Noviherbaspirillum sedimenti TaxID=2320865 RepID=A0A3A3GPV8_9BURK|nr:cytochrome c3 family protein [Noviherbaspirillum sedimenti]RJG03030.1 ammonia-forming cytochrome c nitrite reductase subunit c552 [Noviherbaspirillum sedimenti]
MAKKNRRVLWIYWGVLSVAMVAYFATGLFYKEAATNPLLAPARAAFLPGQTTHGHYQIELACESCHSKSFAGQEAIQEACVKCHESDLKEAKDSHPASKFDDPRNADRLEKIDARMCVTCHVEHKPGLALAMGVTQPQDVCYNCHSGPEEMPQDHKNFKFDGCTAAGCHNYHDNRALYEDFLLKHAQDAKLNDKPQLPQREFAAAVREMSTYPAAKYPFKALSATEQDAPAGKRGSASLQADWLGTAHAKAGVNCSGCHASDGKDGTMNWTDRPTDPTACKGCHAAEDKGFLAGKHGMRLAQDLTPMTPGDARLPMKADAAHKELGCTSCHSAHRFDTKTAAVESCMSCHNDKHTLAYKESPHYALWQKEIAGQAPPGSGVTCASCHMPRMRMSTEDGARIVVQHNQNDTLRPNQKMIRATCMSCHGLGFSIDALADKKLIDNNFKGMPAQHVPSIDMAVAKDAATRSKRNKP